jgi:hypothetical protein
MWLDPHRHGKLLLRSPDDPHDEGEPHVRIPIVMPLTITGLATGATFGRYDSARQVPGANWPIMKRR